MFDAGISGTQAQQRLDGHGQNIAQVDALLVSHNHRDHARNIGILTDLGSVFSRLEQVIGTLDAVLLESNYDPAMLASGSYPAFLKQRIAGSGGHLSNLEAANLLSSVAKGQLRWACLGHLSEQNNMPELALRTHRRVLGAGFPLLVASRYNAGEVLEV